tara:strand:+ start:2760 stop:2942 length:183 start_codon:yes stop_codon:yes gene_type:complete
MKTECEKCGKEVLALKDSECLNKFNSECLNCGHSTTTYLIAIGDQETLVTEVQLEAAYTL